MRKLVFCFAVVFLTVVSAAAGDTQLLSNGDFETGSLSPWFNARDFCSGVCVPWQISTVDPHSGMYSAMDVGNIELRQDFTPTAGADITNVSFWVNSEVGFNAIDFFYTDGSDEEFAISSSPGVWFFIDATGDVNTGKVLEGFSIFGASPDFTTYVDDLSITARGGTTVPEPSTFSMLGGGALILFGALRRRLQR
jgi:hypothetical protein